MAVVLDSNPASATFNSFVSLAEAEDYFAKRLHDTTWSSATTPDKEAALMWSSLSLGQLKWRGVRTSAAQNLSWPRKGMSYTEAAETSSMSDIYTYDPVGYVTTEVVIADNVIPPEIKNVCCENALALMTSDTTTPTASSVAGLAEVKVDTIQIKFNEKHRNTILTSTIRNMCWMFLLNSSPYNVPVLRVG